MIQREIEYFAKKIWNYHDLRHKLQKSDCILVFGSSDDRVAGYAAELFLEGWAPVIIFTGGLGDRAKMLWSEAEADHFAKIAIQLGVPKDKIIIENQSLNSGDNIIFTKKILAAKKMNFKKFILVQKTYGARRTYATFMKRWPGKTALVTSPSLSFEEYIDYAGSRENLINTIVGHLQRIWLYAEKGFQIPQTIPNDVKVAYEKLVAAGYNKELVR
jgi:uncharacterized SAM-binding protein YcdF (DUF218 family)